MNGTQCNAVQYGWNHSEIYEKHHSFNYHDIIMITVLTNGIGLFNHVMIRMHKIINNLFPKYFSNKIIYNNHIHRHNTRTCTCTEIKLPKKCKIQRN